MSRKHSITTSHNHLGIGAHRSHRRQSIAANAIQEEKKRQRTAIPIWPEWSDQEIASEKWDVSHKGKVDAKSKSPSAALHYFEDPEGKLELPQSLKQVVKSWKRPIEFMDYGKPPAMLEQDSSKDKEIDLLSANEHIAGSEVLRWIISGITALLKITQASENEMSGQQFKMRASKEGRDVKIDKNKKETEYVEESMTWKPWHHIWPKDNSKGYLFPTYNASGKYCVKIHWMGCWRKITVDDVVPLNENGRVLLPLGTRDNEIWPLILSKALIKVAALDYAGGIENCDFGDWSVISCLTGWIPEPIPLKNGHKGEIWKLLMSTLPSWKYPTPAPPQVDTKLVSNDPKALSDCQVSQKGEANKLEVKDSKEMKEGKTKKEEKEKGKGIEEKKQKEKSSEKGEKEGRGKEKGGGLSANNNKQSASDPEFVLFASYSSIPKTPLKITTLREMANASETLRQCGLSHSHPHILLLTSVRTCPLVPPPTPVPVPRWKLIRQKKKKQPVEADPVPVEPIKDPEFVQMFSPFLNYCVSPVPISRVTSPVKWDKFRPQTPMESVDEEQGILNADGTREEETPASIINKAETLTSMEKQEISIEVSSTPRDLKPTPKKEATSVGKKTVTEELNKQSPDLEVIDLPPKDKKSNKLNSADKVAGDQPAKGRNSSRAVESKLTVEMKDAKKSPSKDTSQQGSKSAETSRSVAGDGMESVEVKEEALEKDEETLRGEDSESPEEQVKKETSFWIDYDDFSKCFSTLWIYHKPQTYPFYKSHTDIKVPYQYALPGVEAKTDKGKKGAGANNAGLAGVASTPVGRGQTNVSPSMYGSHQPHQEPPPPYLLVDSLRDVELTICFSSFSRWYEHPSEALKSAKSKEAEKEAPDGPPERESASPASPPSGIIIAEPYSWKSLVAGQPSLRIKTTGIKAAVLALPPGRHFLRLMVQAPLGYHLDISSTTPFVFGDEDSVMQHLTKESCRFVHQASTTAQALGTLFKTFTEPSVKVGKTNDLGLPKEPVEYLEEHIQDFFTSLTIFVRRELGGNCPLELSFAIEALKLKNLLHYPFSTFDRSQRKRPDSEGMATRLNSPCEGVLSVPDLQHIGQAATKIQASFRGFYSRKLTRSFEEGTKENKIVIEVLGKVWGLFSNNMEASAVQLYRTMFEYKPSLYPLYPFYNDEWTKIAFADYQGSYNEQNGNSWCVIFRDVFYVKKPVLVVPRLYINIPSCVLRVVDNDTKEDLPRVFMKVAPKELQPNVNGYTFVADAKSGENSIPAGKFRLRLIGGADPLPASNKESSVNTSFHTREIRDFYLPNRHNIIMRYTVKTSVDCLASIQFGTSKSDVYFKLEVLDHGEEVISAQGKGHLVIPAVMFYANDSDFEEEEKQAGTKKDRQSSSRSSSKGHRTGKRLSSPRLSPTVKQMKKGNEDLVPVDHKYIIQVTVLRDSWPLSKKQWIFVTAKLSEKDDPEEQARIEKEKHAASAKGRRGVKKEKESDGRSSKNHNSSPRPESQYTDESKPSWVLRVVTDLSNPEPEIRKDTERQDEIRAMKAAWEAAEPGRAAKALQSRMKFLSENTIRLEKAKSVEECEGEGEQITVTAPTEQAGMTPTSPGPSESDSAELTLAPPPIEKEYILKPFDISPFIRTLGRTVILDEAEQEKIHEEHARQQRKFLAAREEVLRRRDEDLNLRNADKEAQLQFYEDIQAKVDEIRAMHKSLREKYCQKYMEQPEPEAALDAESDKKRKSPSPKRKKSAKANTPSKGKKK